MLKTISLKIEKKKLELKRKAKFMHLQTKQVKATQPIDENESKKDALSEARDLGDSNPVALERSVW